MSKAKLAFSNPAFQKTETSPPGQFNLVVNTSSLNAVFDFRPLDVEESQKIDQLLKDNVSDVTTGGQLLEDARRLKECSAEIKAIGKQWIVLTGERVHRAREILKPYRDGTFMKWLDLAMGSRKTGYNALAYYELYEELPHDDTREQFKQIAQRPAYILASRDGDIEAKVEIIKKAKGMATDELVTLIQEAFPAGPGDRRSRRSVNSGIIANIRSALQKLYGNKAAVTGAEKAELRALKRLLEEIIS
jgi:hypothetical protein